MNKLAIGIVIILVIAFILIAQSPEGFSPDPNMVDAPLPYYRKFDEKTYGKDAVIVGFHYTTWCGYCKQMKPVWEAVTNNLRGSAIKFVSNDEDQAPTPGINSFPTIIKYRGGKARKYDGRADYQQLRSWILAPNIVETAGSAW